MIPMLPRDRLIVGRYLKQLVAAHAINNGPFSPVRGVMADIEPILRQWGHRFVVRIEPSGSFAKGTAVRGGTDIDIFVSMSSALELSLRDIYEQLFTFLYGQGLAPRRQNVSVGIQCRGYSVDVTPARRQAAMGFFHSLYSNRSGTWLQTNVRLHRQRVAASGRLDEIRLMKIWRNRLGLDWPSFYLELFVIDALHGRAKGALWANMPAVLAAMRGNLEGRRLVDPANTNNVVSDTLNAAEKSHLAYEAARALDLRWEDVFR